MDKKWLKILEVPTAGKPPPQPKLLGRAAVELAYEGLNEVTFTVDSFLFFNLSGKVKTIITR